MIHQTRRRANEVVRPEVWLSGQDEDGQMGTKRHKPEDVVAKLRQVDVLVSQGQSVGDPAADGKAIFARQHPVEHQQIRPSQTLDKTVESCATVGRLHAKTFPRQKIHQEDADLRIVLDDVDAWLGRHDGKYAARANGGNRRSHPATN